MNPRKNKNERLTRYRQRLYQAGFKRVSAYISSDLVLKLQNLRQQGECLGRTLERILLGSSRLRPQFYAPEEKINRKIRQLMQADTHYKAKKVIR